MNYSEAREKLEKYGQQHLLKFYDELSEEEKENLLREINSIDLEVLKAKESEPDNREITPIMALTVDEIEKNKELYYEKGIDAIRRGKLCCILLAGGQGTRLGLDGPKGTLNVGIHKDLYLFEMLVNNILDVVRQAGCMIHFYIMTSDKNDKETRAFFKEHDYFGYDPEYLHFFVQEMSPTTDFEQKVYLESKGHISLSPNGNGGWFRSLKLNGLYDEIKAMGTEWFNVFAVDNGLQRIADPYFLGAVITSGFPAGAKVIRKNAPDEKVGVACRRGGQPSFIEYYELTQKMMDEKNENGEPAYNFGAILNYLFSFKTLSDNAEKAMPLHMASKKIPHIDPKGNLVKPVEPNGYKYETLVLDMIEMMDDCLIYEVVREKEFAPIKNLHGVDSLDSARELYAKNNIEL